MDTPSTWLGALHMEVPCPNCRSGAVVRIDGDRLSHDHCDVCGGLGTVPVSRHDRLSRYLRPPGRP